MVGRNSISQATIAIHQQEDLHVRRKGYPSSLAKVIMDFIGEPTQAELDEMLAANDVMSK